jgi:hypothetical protein
MSAAYEELQSRIDRLAWLLPDHAQQSLLGIDPGDLTRLRGINERYALLERYLGAIRYQIADPSGQTFEALFDEFRTRWGTFLHDAEFWLERAAEVEEPFDRIAGFWFVAMALAAPDLTADGFRAAKEKLVFLWVDGDHPDAAQLSLLSIEPVRLPPSEAYQDFAGLVAWVREQTVNSLEEHTLTRMCRAAAKLCDDKRFAEAAGLVLATWLICKPYSSCADGSRPGVTLGLRLRLMMVWCDAEANLGRHSLARDVLSFQLLGAGGRRSVDECRASFGDNSFLAAITTLAQLYVATCQPARADDLLHWAFKVEGVRYMPVADHRLKLATVWSRALRQLHSIDGHARWILGAYVLCQQALQLPVVPPGTCTRAQVRAALGSLVPSVALPWVLASFAVEYGYVLAALKPEAACDALEEFESVIGSLYKSLGQTPDKTDVVNMWTVKVYATARSGRRDAARGMVRHLLREECDVVFSADIRSIMAVADLFFLLTQDAESGPDTDLQKVVAERLVGSTNAHTAELHSPDDQRMLAEITTHLRRRLGSLVLRWVAQATTKQERQVWAARSLEWDAVLAKSLLLQDYGARLSEGVVSNGEKVVAAPDDRWPLPGNPPVVTAHRRDRRSRLMPSANTCVRVGLQGGSPVRWHPFPSDEYVWTERGSIPDELRAPITPADLVGTLSDRDRLLKVGVLPDGRLYWNLFCAEDGQFRLLDQHAGEQSDAHKLRCHALLHDFAVNLLYCDSRSVSLLDAAQRAMNQGRGGVTNALAQLGKSIMESGLGQESAHSALAACALALANHRCESGMDQEIAAGVHAAMERRIDLCGRPSELGAHLDSATTELTSAVSPRFNLERVARHLVKAHHLIVEADATLQSLPFSHLSVCDGGPALFELVSFTRCSLTLGFDVLQRRLAPSNGEREGKTLVSAAWFPENGEIWVAARDFLARQRFMAKENGYLWLSAAHNPTASTAQLAAILAEGPVVALVVNAHGVDPAGVFLSDGPWRGIGLDLARVGLVVLLVCSMGTMHVDDLRDVAGFTVNLLLSRARSVVAARWPVQCELVADFGNELTKQYLLGQTQSTDDTEGRRRAEALQRARAVLLSEGIPGMLNTVAGFELFGLP